MHSMASTTAAFMDYKNVTNSFGQMPARASFLALFILLGFVGNCILLVTILQSKRLRLNCFNLLIINHASVNLIDTVIIMPFVLGSTITQKWEYGTDLCKFNAFFIQLSGVVTTYAVLGLPIERFIKYINPTAYEHRFKYLSLNVIIIVPWVLAFIISVPISFGAVTSSSYPYRDMCSVGYNTSLGYIFFVFFVGCLIPSVSIVVMLILLVRFSITRKVFQTLGGDDKKDVVKFLLCITIIFYVLEMPFLIMSHIDQIMNSDEINSMTSSWYVPADVQQVFTTLRFGNVIVLPILTFTLRKSIWKGLKDMVLCRRSNHVNDVLPGANITQVTKFESKEDISATNVTSFKVPVLFANSDGLHVETYENFESSESESESIYQDSQGNDRNNDTKIIQRKCDVNGSVEFLNEDTSDYDSQIDPFSVSNPISVKDLPNDLTNATELTTVSPIHPSKLSIDNSMTMPNAVPPIKVHKIVNNNPSGESIDSGIDSKSNTHEKIKKKNKTECFTNVLEEGNTKGDSKTKTQDNKVSSAKKSSKHVQDDLEGDITEVQKIESVNSECNTVPVDKAISQKKKRRKKRSEETDFKQSELKIEIDNGDDAIPPRPPVRLKPLPLVDNVKPKRKSESPSIGYIDPVPTRCVDRLEKTVVPDITNNEEEESQRKCNDDDERKRKESELEPKQRVSKAREKRRRSRTVSGSKTVELKGEERKRHSRAGSQTDLMPNESSTDPLPDEEPQLKKKDKSESKQDLLLNAS